MRHFATPLSVTSRTQQNPAQSSRNRRIPIATSSTSVSPLIRSASTAMQSSTPDPSPILPSIVPLTTHSTLLVDTPQTQPNGMRLITLLN